jgi:uncharacterized protein YdhG (YjbR/CyaY superfamily)
MAKKTSSTKSLETKSVRKKTSAAKPKTIDEYLAAVPVPQRATLEKLRRTIKANVPDAEECISYGVAAFRLNGITVAGFSASLNHCSYYPMSGKVVEQLTQELRGYETSKGTVRFPSNRPLPNSLVRQLIKARLREIEGG